jgi:uncharacterized repeat protein (TIGR03803 family)
MGCPKSFPRLPFQVSFLVATLLALAMCAYGQQEIVLYSFNPNIEDGLNPGGNLIFDASGNLYGTTFNGGRFDCYYATFNCGTAFELSPAAGGGWTEKLLHDLGDGTDGANPAAAMVFDTSGNLYGTAADGNQNFGAVFELTRAVDGNWTEKVLHRFVNNGKDGMYPEASLILDASGNLYGTTTRGGAFDGGTVFELARINGGWTERILHNFVTNGTDGIYPFGNLILDASGHFYSTTSEGGTYGNGTVFELAQTASGDWKERIIHSFNPDGKDALQSFSGLCFHGGHLYGTSPGGGTHGYGTVFEFSRAEGGDWTEKILHDFNFDGTDGVDPEFSVACDASGALYGTTGGGGLYGFGMVFKLTASSNGTWTEEVLHSFNDNDGRQAEGGVILDAAGNVYGTTYWAGAFGEGLVFEITP